ncbi:uncharacterized protein [Coffea arabica]|uniref:Myb/SANT-like domain-containing protein n=1 Tax=Coffea arabica TaxID=13443 RepID=A0ABM4X7U6_COFAR
MPPITRRASKALKTKNCDKGWGSNSAWGENDLQKCISNYYKMRKQRRNPGHQKLYFTRQQEIEIAKRLVSMHTASEIRDNNIGSYVVPEIQQQLNCQFGTSFTWDSIRAKYYALRELTKLYIAFKRRETGLGWDSQNFTWLMDDSKWAELAQVNPKYLKFQDDCTVYHLLEEVFVNQGATGDFSAGFENEPRTSPEERYMENLAQSSRGKGRSDAAHEGVETELVGANAARGRKGKGKRKSGDMSSGSPMSTASHSASDRYMKALDTIESLVSRHKSSSIGVSVSSPDKQCSGRGGPPKTAYEAAMDQLRGMENVSYAAKMAVAEILKDKQELAIWNLAQSDADRITFMKIKGCFPPDTQEPPPPPPF